MIGTSRITCRSTSRFISWFGWFFSVGVLLCCRARGEIVLPVEVMGPPPYVESVTLTLDAGEGSKAVKLRVKAHNVSYKNKGWMRVNSNNDADWFMLWNDVPAIKMAKPDRAYGGFGGGFCTITFDVGTPDVQFKDGDNKIEFKYQYKHPDHGTAGYRIIYLDIRNAANRSLLAADATRFDDPRTWEPPHAGEPTLADSIAAGKEIWRNAVPAGPNCMDCHTDTGRDLKYYNISNKVIIEQCKKSGFSPEQGRQVASYIRSIDIPVVRRARPWNPPYQPGPGTDSRSAYEWAAGAGVDAVLKNDAEMLPHMFGTGTQAEIDAATDIRADMNLREMPIAVQFPDWIHWIPRVHPMDLWGRRYWETEPGEKNPDKNNPYQSYLTLKELFEDGLADSPDLYKKVNNEFQRNVLWWIDPGDQFHPWCEKEGKILDRATDRGYTPEVTKLNLSRWRAVKLWELFNTYNAQDKAANHIPTAEKYQWPAGFFSVFQIAAHFIGDDRGTSCFAWEAPEVGIYFSSIWYQLQMVLNSGMRVGGVVEPIDWAYNHAHVNLMGDVSGIPEPLRLVQNLIKCYQQRDKAGEPIRDDSWTMREVSPWRHYGNFDADQTTYEALDSYGHGKELRLRILDSMLGQFLRKVKDFDASDWPRNPIREDGSDSWWQVLPPNYTPVQAVDEVTNNHVFADSGIGDAIDADAMYRLIPRLYELGLNGARIRQLANWCAEVWPGNPRTDWDVRKEDFELTILSPATARPATIALARGMGTSEKTVRLSLVAQDPNDDRLMYRWEMIDGPRDEEGKLRHRYIDDRERATVTSSALNTVGNYEFEVVVDDGAWEKKSSVEVVVTSQGNTAPRSFGQSLTTEIETPVAIVLRGDDPEDDALTYRVVEAPSHGSISGTGKNLTYTADAGFSGTDFFRFTVEDAEVHSTKSRVNITVTGGNAKPIANGQSKTTEIETSVDIVLGGSDLEGGPLTFRVVDEPSHGSLSGTGHNVTYTPDVGFSGDDFFMFTVNDGEDDSEEARVNITVVGGNGKPLAYEQSLSTDVDTPVSIVLDGRDREGESLTFRVVDEPSHGSLSGTGRNVTYTPDPGFSGDDSFTFTVNDGVYASAKATIGITVGGDNAKPTARGQTVTTESRTPVDIVLSGNDREGRELTFRIVDDPSHGSVSGTGRNVTYTPDAGFSGDHDYFGFVVNDGEYDSAKAWVRITVQADINDPGTPGTPVDLDDPGGSDCGGCSSSEGSSVAGWLVILGMLALMSRARFFKSC